MRSSPSALSPLPAGPWLDAPSGTGGTTGRGGTANMTAEATTEEQRGLAGAQLVAH